jgi:hypothetical protein
MSHPPGAGSAVIELALSVPAAGGLRVIATDLISRIAEYLGAAAAGAGDALERAVADVAPEADANVDLEFRNVDRDLVIHARCGGRTAEVRYRLTAG